MIIATAAFALLTACGGAESSVPGQAPAGGPGSVAPFAGAVPSPTPTPMTSIPSHIPTWVYDEYNSVGGAASAAAVQKYVTYAEGGLGNAKAQKDCATVTKSCYSVYYFDPNFLYAGTSCPSQPDASFIAASTEASFVHEAGYSDFAHRAVGEYTQNCKGVSTTIPVYVANQTNPSVTAWYLSYLQQNGDNWDYYFMDDTSASVLTQTYGPGGGMCQDSVPNQWCSSTTEYPTDASVALAHSSFAAALNHVNGMPMQFFFNGVGFSGQTPKNLNLLSMGNGHFSGAICENCLVSAGTLRPSNYAPTLNAMAQVDASPTGAIVLLNTGASAAGSAAQISQRLVTTAIAWLGYKDGKTIVFPDFEYNTQSLAVWPEDLIYPSGALQAMTAGASDIAVANGVYRREFSACYNNQVAIGPCAAIVNAGSAAVAVPSAWFQQSYGHVIALSGGDVTAGGSVSTTSTAFTPNVTAISSGGAILLAQ